MFTWAGYEGAGVAEMEQVVQGQQHPAQRQEHLERGSHRTSSSPRLGQDWDAGSLNQGDTGTTRSGRPRGGERRGGPGVREDVPVLQGERFLQGLRRRVQRGPLDVRGRSRINTLPEQGARRIPGDYEGLFDPKCKGRIGTYDDALNMVSMAAVATGNDPQLSRASSCNGPVREWLMKLEPQLKVLSTSIGDQINLLYQRRRRHQARRPASGTSPGAEPAGRRHHRLTGRPEGGRPSASSTACDHHCRGRRTAQNAIAYANALIEGDTAVADAGVREPAGPR